MKKIFTISGLQINKAQWNTDFDMFARRDSEGKIFSTDKSRKYSLRQELLNNGHKVLIRKHRDNNNNYLSLNNILKANNCVFKTKKSNKNDDINTHNNLEMQKLFNNYIDLRLFGFIINPTGINFSEKGTVQLQYSNDIFSQPTEEIINDITSFKTSGENNEPMTTIGKQTVIDIGFLNYTITIEPNSYMSSFKNYNPDASIDEISDNFNKDILNFKEALNTDVTNLNSSAKAGVTNLYNIHVTMKDNLSSLDKYLLGLVKVNKIDDLISIDFSNTLKSISEVSDNIEKVEVVYSKGMEENNILSLNGFISELKKFDFEVVTSDLFD